MQGTPKNQPNQTKNPRDRLYLKIRVTMCFSPPPFLRSSAACAETLVEVAKRPSQTLRYSRVIAILVPAAMCHSAGLVHACRGTVRYTLAPTLTSPE